MIAIFTILPDLSSYFADFEQVINKISHFPDHEQVIIKISHYIDLIKNSHD